MRDFGYFLLDTAVGFALVCVVAIGLLIGGSIGLTIWLNSNVCDQVAETTGKQVEFGNWSGCYVEVDGRMVPLDVWRSAEVAS